jgi:hypothetical protein
VLQIVKHQTIMMIIGVLLLLALLVDRSTAVFTFRANAPWTPRQRHVSWTDGASIFIAGGQVSGGSTVNDAWTSADGGATWYNAFSLNYAYGIAAASFQGTQYLMGGRSSGCADFKQVQTWSPSTGSSTTIPAWSARAFAMAVVWNPPPATSLPSQLLLIGGSQCGMPYLNDVWSFTGSGSWSYRGLGAFPPVASAGVASILKGSQIVLAGGAYSNAGSSYVYNTVWVGAYSGVTSQLAWTLRCTAAPWSARTVSLAATASDYLYMIESSSQVNLPLAGSNDVRQRVDHVLSLCLTALLTDLFFVFVCV